MRRVPLNDTSHFELIGGVWKGDRGLLKPARVLRGTNFAGDGLIDFEDVVELDVEARHFPARRLACGDIVVERSGGGPKQPVGRVSLFASPDEQDYFSSNFTTAIRVRDRKVFDPNYVALYLHALYLDGATKKLQRATTGLRNLDWQGYLDFEVPIRPLKEQESLARVIGTVRRAYRIERGLCGTTAALKNAVMKSLFTYGLRGEVQKETAIGLVPESWKVAPLSEIAKLERGRFLHRPRNEPRFYGGTTPFVQTGDVVRSAGCIRKFSQTLNDRGVAISRVFKAGTILVTIAANIGYSGVLEFDAACPDSLVGISPSDKLSNLYLNYYLQTQQPKMDQDAPKGTQKNINIQFLSPWPVPVPSRAEQGEIVMMLRALDRKITLHQQKRAVLEELFKSLLHKLMIGEITADQLDLSALEKH